MPWSRSTGSNAVLRVSLGYDPVMLSSSASASGVVLGVRSGVVGILCPSLVMFVGGGSMEEESGIELDIGRG